MNLGRFRLGDTVVIGCSLGDVPDVAPRAIVRDSQSNQVVSVMLPKAEPSARRFALPLFIGSAFQAGQYSVEYLAVIGGVSTSPPSDEFFVVAGGDRGGAVISMHAIDSAGAVVVIAQLENGRLAFGRNPR